MPTVYERMIAYSEQTGNEALPHRELAILSEKISNELKKRGEEYPKAHYDDWPEKRRVTIYPDSLNNFLDEHIASFYQIRHTIPPSGLTKKERRRWRKENLPPSAPEPPRPPRQRKAVNKPAYSARVNQTHKPSQNGK